MSRHDVMRQAAPFLMVAPLAAFLMLFFFIPITTMMKAAVSDPVASTALPLTAEAMRDWDGTAPPEPEIQSAFLQDVAAISDEQLWGDLVRRLNSVQPGFRSLMSRTRSAMPGADLVAIDARWARPEFWAAIQTASGSALTDRYLLAALDMERDSAGAIVAMPAEASINRLIMGRTFLISGVVTIMCVLIGLPYAMTAASVQGWARAVMLAAVLLPLWTSLLVRTAAWYILLQDNGLINGAIQALGLADGPLPLIFNRAGVVIAMTHVLLPFMVLPIFSVLVGSPRNLMPAAASLGAPPFKAFLHVLLPLSLRGVISGSLLVFMAAIGYYITPALIGGAGDQMISSVIAYYAMGAANWGMAGALGLVLLLATLLLFAIYLPLSRDQEGRP